MDERTRDPGDARPALPELASSATGEPLLDLADVSDLGVDIEVHLGSVALDVRDLVHLRPGSLLKLSCLTGEPLDVLVNGTPIAKGEVRVHGERFALRVTEIRSAARRDESPEKEVPRAESSAP